MRSLPKKARKNAPTPKDPTQAIVPLGEVEKAHILDVYGRLQRNKSRTAKALGIGLNTLRRKLAAYGEE
jgi:DNA-binding NtrC family response regulator